MVEALYRTLAEQGVALKTRGADISFDAPAGVMTDDLRAQLRACKADMLAYLIEVEEMAAVFEVEYGNLPTLSRVTASRRVNERRSSERESSDQKAVRSHPDFMRIESACLAALGCGLEIVSVEIINELEKAA